MSPGAAVSAAKREETSESCVSEVSKRSFGMRRDANARLAPRAWAIFVSHHIELYEPL